jgi:hypothetical protein
MALNAELTVRLDAKSLVDTFLGELSGSSGSLNAIPSPASGDDLAAAEGSGGSFLAGPIREAIGGLASVGLPIPEIPATLQRIEATLAAVEGFTSRDVGADVTALLQQLTAELERANEQGVPGTILTVADLLSRSPTWSALAPLLSVLTGGSQNVALPEAVTEYLPAFASTVRVIAGLMVYETVLAEGERLTAIVSSLFNAERARRDAAALQAAFQIGDRTLAQELASVGAADTARIEALIVAMDNIAAHLAGLDEYVSQGMGFGEATLVHFNVAGAQADVAAAGALLRDPDLGALRRVVESLAQRAQPIADSSIPGRRRRAAWTPCSSWPRRRWHRPPPRFAP